MHVGTDCSWLDEQTDLNNALKAVNEILKSIRYFTGSQCKDCKVLIGLWRF